MVGKKLLMTIKIFVRIILRVLSFKLSQFGSIRQILSSAIELLEFSTWEPVSLT